MTEANRHDLITPGIGRPQTIAKYEPLRRLEARCGGSTKTYTLIGVSPPSYYDWRNGKITPVWLPLLIDALLALTDEQWREHISVEA